MSSPSIPLLIMSTSIFTGILGFIADIFGVFEILKKTEIYEVITNSNLHLSGPQIILGLSILIFLIIVTAASLRNTPPISLDENTSPRLVTQQFPILFGDNWAVTTINDITFANNKTTTTTPLITDAINANLSEKNYLTPTHTLKSKKEKLDLLIQPKNKGYFRISTFFAITDGTSILLVNRTDGTWHTVKQKDTQLDMIGAIPFTCGKMVQGMLQPLTHTEITKIEPIPGIAMEEIELGWRYWPTQTEFCVMQGIAVYVQTLQLNVNHNHALHIIPIRDAMNHKNNLTAKAILAINYLKKSCTSSPTSTVASQQAAGNP